AGAAESGTLTAPSPTKPPTKEDPPPPKQLAEKPEITPLPPPPRPAIASGSTSGGKAGKALGPGADLGNGTALDPGQLPPAPPEPKGWPHAILTGKSTNCAREPLPQEVLVYRDGNFGGSCASLMP